MFLLSGGESSIGIRYIRAIRGFQNFLHCTRNLAQDFGQYTGERPEMTPQNEESKKAKTTKGKLNHEG